MIPYGRQSISEEDIQAVVDVLQSDFLTQGAAVPSFEDAICNYTGALHGVAVSNGTAALHLACLALDLGRGDILWTSPISFVASANCALYCGASVDFVDIDSRTFNLSVDALELKLELAKKSGQLPKIVIPVHLCGMPCDMERISRLSAQYGFYVIEDACHAIGGKYRGDSIGSCRYSDVTVFSFHPVKTITTGEGGMAVTNEKKLADKMALLRGHGITRDPSLMSHEVDGPWYYEQVGLGYNYRMTDIQAALGISQLGRLDQFVSRRHEISAQYNSLISHLPLQYQYSPEGCYSGFHLYVVRLNVYHINKTHRQVFEELRSLGVGVNLHYIPIHTQPWYKALGFVKGNFPIAEQYYTEAISLPMYPDLSNSQVEKVVDILCKILSD